MNDIKKTVYEPKNTTSLFVEVNPIGKPRMTRADKWKHRDCVNRYWAFKDGINIAANKQNFEIGNGFSYVFTIEMPKSWSKKKKEKMDGQLHEQKPDLDNMLKAVWDSLLKDDSKISLVCGLKKEWGYEGSIFIYKGIIK